MSTLEEARKRAATTYNAASDFYDHPANTFWTRYGRRTVERPGLTADARGFTQLEVVAEADTQPVNSPDEWWPMVMGSGYRGTVDQLSAAERERVRSENSDFIRQASIKSLEANVVYAVAIKT